ncbi:putative Exocyst complex component SEC15B [Cocos nucifera]|uniref:Putative Exocyst complex component SEC15B n=1 Tax=Cocos nucifera TaxID=13894 RepID=A0A8K0IKJ6_COCNU|nr:putative Exocyst complex component SEC15B [Cocos nucifera]
MEWKDLIQLYSVICNGEDLGPFIHKPFASGHPKSLLHSLHQFARSKESDIEEVCKVHYQDFICTVNNLRSLLSDIDSLKSALFNSNAAFQSAAGPLLSSRNAYLEARAVASNLSTALAAARPCICLLDLLACANTHLTTNDLYLSCGFRGVGSR